MDWFKKIRPLLLLVGILCLTLFDFSRIPHVCILEYLLNLHCPLCGATGSMTLLIHGEFLLSATQNILAFGVILYIGLCQILILGQREDRILILDRLYTGLCIVQFVLLNI